MSSKFLISCIFAVSATTAGSALAINSSLKKDKQNLNKEKDNNLSHFSGKIIETNLENLQNNLFENYDCQALTKTNEKILLKNCKIFKEKKLLTQSEVENNLKVIVSFVQKENLEIVKIDILPVNSDKKYFSIEENKKVENVISKNVNFAITKVLKNNIKNSIFHQPLNCEVGKIIFECNVYQFEKEINSLLENKEIIFSDLGEMIKNNFFVEIEEESFVLLHFLKPISEEKLSSEKISIISNENQEDDENPKELIFEYKKSVINKWNENIEEIYFDESFENINKTRWGVKTISEEFLPDNTRYQYLVVNALDVSQEKSVSNSSKLITKNENSKDIKNYKCEFINSFDGSKIYDESCVLYEINISNNDDYIDFYEFTSDPNSFKRINKPINSKKYILKLNKAKYAYLNTSENQISLLSTIEKDKEFAKLSEEFKLNKNFGFKKNILLAKIKENKGPNTFNSYKCKLKGDEKESCNIYSFSEDPINSEGKFSFNSSNLSSANNSYFSKDKYVLIEIKNKDFNSPEKFLRTTKPIIYGIGPNNLEREYLKTVYVDLFVGKFQSNLQNSKLIMVKESPEDFLIVYKDQEGDESITNDFEINGSENKKNYKCSINSYIDEDCLLIPINETNNKPIDINNVKSSKNSIKTKAEFKNKKFFKLLVKNLDFFNHTYQPQEFINIQSISEANKSYGKLKVVAKHSREGYNNFNFLLLKSKSQPINADNLQSLKYSLPGSRSKYNCNVYKANISTGDNKTYKDIDLSTANQDITSKNDILENSYVVIKIPYQGLYSHEVDGELFLHTSSGEKINDYEIIAPIFSSGSTIQNENSLIL